MGKVNYFLAVISILGFGARVVHAQGACKILPEEYCARLEPGMAAFIGQQIASGPVKPPTPHGIQYYSDQVITFRVVEPLWGLKKDVKTVEIHFQDSDAGFTEPRFLAVRREANGDYTYNCIGGLNLAVDNPWVDEFRRHLRDMDPVTVPVHVVIDGAELVSLPSVKVEIRRNGEVFQATSNEEGDLEISGVRPGFYSFTASRADLFSKEPRSVSILPGSCGRLLVFMNSSAKIMGQILDSSGEPVRNESGFSLIAWSADKDAPDYSKSRWVYTDKDGNFEVRDILPGSYYLGSNIRETTEPRKGTIPRIYYPGVARRQDARLLVVGPGQQLDGVIFRLPDFGKKRRLTFRAVSADGVPVQAWIEDGPAEVSDVKVSSIGQDKLTDENGRATFEVWAASEYRIELHPCQVNAFEKSESVLIPTNDSDTEITVIFRDLFLRPAPK